MLTLRPYNPTDYDSLNYTLDNTQAEFTGTIDTWITNNTNCLDDDKILVTIVEPISVEQMSDTAIGFFILDTGADKFNITDNQNAVLIRSFSINPNFQGKGYGKLAMKLATDFVKEHLPTINELVLSVNCRNIRAYQVYLKAGYQDTGKTIIGVAGKQHVLSLPL